MTRKHLRNAIPTALVGMALLVTVPVPAGADTEGRWKLNGNGGCYFDSADEGANQCDPTTMPPQSGRWKIDGSGGCTLDPNDSGPDQCTPTGQPAGRWKIDGAGGCYLDTTDSGPNQCTPSDS